MAARATGLVQRRRQSKGGASESLLIASAVAEKSDRARTLTSTTTDDAAVDTEMKVWGCLVAARATGLFQRRRRLAKERGSVRFVVYCVCGYGEVRSSVKVDVNDDGRCGRRYRDEGLGMSCGGDSYQTGSKAAAAAAAEQRGSVRVVVNSVFGSREFRSGMNVDVDDDGRCGSQYGDEGLGMSCGGERYWNDSGAAAAAAAELIERDFVRRCWWMALSWSAGWIPFK